MKTVTVVSTCVIYADHTSILELW